MSCQYFTSTVFSCSCQLDQWPALEFSKYCYNTHVDSTVVVSTKYTSVNSKQILWNIEIQFNWLWFDVLAIFSSVGCSAAFSHQVLIWLWQQWSAVFVVAAVISVANAPGAFHLSFFFPVQYSFDFVIRSKRGLTSCYLQSVQIDMLPGFVSPIFSNF